MSRVATRRSRVLAAPFQGDDELNNGGEAELVEERDDPIEEAADDDNTAPVAYRTRSRSISPHTLRTKRTITTTQETVTVTKPASSPPDTLAPTQPAYQPSHLSSSSAVFPLVTKRRLRFVIPLLVSTLLTLLLLYLRAPHTSHALSRQGQFGSRQTGQDRTAPHAHRAVHNPSQRSEYDQYASSQDDKEEMSKERARRIIDEVHGRAAQINQQQQQHSTDGQPQPHYHPLRTAHPSAKDIEHDREAQYETQGEGSWVQRAADWLGFGPYMRLEKREDGVHHVRGDDDEEVGKFDYIRSKATGRGKANVQAEQGGERDGNAAADGEKEGEAHRQGKRLVAHLKELEQRFGEHVASVKQRIAQKTVPPYQQIRAAEQTSSDASTAESTAEHDDSSVPVEFVSTSPDHPLLDPLHSILASVHSLTSRPDTPAAEAASASYWSRLVDSVVPSAVSDTARDVYDVARLEATREAWRLRRAMTAQYDKLRQDLRAVAQDVREGTGEPLELYEQYNAEPVQTEEATAITHHTREK